MKTSNWSKYFFTGIILLVMSINLHAATHKDIASALEEARRDLNISIAMEERITFRMAKLKNSGSESQGVIEDYEFYLSLVRAMVAENRKVVAELEALNAMYNVRKASDRSVKRDDRSAMVDPPIPEEQVVDEVAALDRQLDSSLAEFDEMLLKELDLIIAKSSEKMHDLGGEAEAAAERLREKGIDIDTDTGEESAESGESPSEVEKKAETEEGTSETGKETTTENGEDTTESDARDISRKEAEGSESHPRNRYEPKDDDIVARQLREAAEEETDPELRAKLWKEYEQYKKNTSK